MKAQSKVSDPTTSLTKRRMDGVKMAAGLKVKTMDMGLVFC